MIPARAGGALLLALLTGLVADDAASELHEVVEMPPLTSIGLAVASSARVDLALAGLDAQVEAAMQRLNVPGLAVVVVAEGRVVLLRGYGWRDVQQQLPVTEHTIFPLGSATKPFTAFVLGTLADEKKVDFFVPVRRVLPSFRLWDALAGERITLADMLTHRSGLPRHDAVWYGDSGLTRAELVGRLSKLEPTARFRSRFQYSNLMFVAAGHVAEVVSGQSWEQLVRDRVLVPLGMERTGFSLAQAQALGDVARPYRDREHEIVRAPFRDVTLIAPAGGLWSSADDLGRWLQMLLARGTWQGRQLIDEGTLTALMRPITPTRLATDDKALSQAYYGLGWFVDTYRGRLRAYHGGNLDGFTALVTLLPNEKIGVAVLANAGGTGLPEALVRTVADRLLGRSGQDWLGRAALLREAAWGVRSHLKEIRAKRRLTPSAPALPVARYAGRYTNPGYGDLLIVENGAALEMIYNRIHSPLEHWHFETFNVGSSEDPSFEDVKLTFSLDDATHATSVAVPFEPSASPIVFRRADPPAAAVDWPADGFGSFQDGATVVSVSRRDERAWLSWPGVAEGELVPVWTDEARIAGRPPVRIRYAPATSSRPPSLIAFTTDAVRVADRVP
ncbi:MAG: serine hydrolase [Thermoanaerobaculaceae bacterium]|nr:serine hydrolase [Thermoanaerobaculaceae bacterium]MDI9621964.1 serine hydrolase [Acidobacteriota bacterium]NLH12222.1 serine hydrolase [Holophagae bacterium]HPW55622.1 serine hydrolase [Thermoanaerobaculaceae bacterium]